VRKDYLRKITVILSTFLSSSWAKKWFFWQISFAVMASSLLSNAISFSFSFHRNWNVLSKLQLFEVESALLINEEF
jgi:hypothetical protein